MQGEATPDDSSPTAVIDTTPPDAPQPSFALRNPLFLRFWIAITLALTGLWVRITVQGYLVYELTEDPFLLGLVGFVNSIPTLLLSPVVGVVADRFERRRVLLVTQSVTALALLALGVLDASGHLTVNHILIISAIAGMASAFDWPARLSIVPNLVKRHEMQSAVALNSASFNGARILGPVIGGVLLGIIGTAACFFLAAGAFVPSLVVVATLTIDRTLPTGKRESPLSNLVAGYRYIWNFPAVRSLLSVDLIPVMFGMSFFALLPAIAKDVYDGGSRQLGFLYAADGAGAVLGVLAVATLTSLRNRGRLVLIFVFAFSILLMLFAISPNLWIGLIMIFLLGVSSALYGTLADTLIQTLIDDAFRGRVMAVYSTFWGMTPVGYLLAGTIASQWNTQAAIFINGMIVCVYVIALTITNPGLRRLQ